jgi:peroxiredoxin Q/BCP
MYNLIAAFSFLCSSLSLGLLFIHPDIPLWVFPVPAFLGWLSGIVAVKVRTGKIDLFASVYSLLVYGYILDAVSATLPFFLVAFVLLWATYATRAILIKQLGYVRQTWIEPTALISGLAMYAWTNISHRAGWEGWVFPVPVILFAFMCLAGSFAELKAFRRGAKKELGVEIGKKAPDFSLPDQDGKTVTLSEYHGIQSVLLLFVRGDWCPTCHIMLRTYEKNNDQFKRKNVMIIALGPDPQGVNKEMVKKLSLNYRILADDKQEALAVYGIQYLEPIMGQQFPVGSPLPASILIDKNGIVRHFARSDRAGEFLNPMQIFSVLEKMEA